MTTYPPPDGSWPDTDTPDLGYHYPTMVPNPDSDNDGLPDWWEMNYFGNLSHSSGDLDSHGNYMLGYAYIDQAPEVGFVPHFCVSESGKKQGKILPS